MNLPEAHAYIWKDVHGNGKANDPECDFGVTRYLIEFISEN